MDRAWGESKEEERGENILTNPENKSRLVKAIRELLSFSSKTTAF